VVTILVGVCQCSVEREGRGWSLALAASSVACGVLVSLLLFFVPVVVVVLCGGVLGALRGQKSCGLSRCCRGICPPGLELVVDFFVDEKNVIDIVSCPLSSHCVFL
jgi:hypothetical protein